MSEDYPATKLARQQSRLTLVMFLDAAFSCAVLFWWGHISLLLSDPIRWATWSPLAPQPELLDFPFVMIWGLPLIGVALGWILKTGGSTRQAVWVASFPLLYIATLVACFYVVPTLSS